jgi:hypothetical protein
MKFIHALPAALLAGLTLAARGAETAPQRTTLEFPYGEFWSEGNETFFVFKSTPTQRVTLVGTNLKLVCDHLNITTVGLGKDVNTGVLPPLEKFKYLLATGNVQIVQTDREARAGRAEVFPREDKIELTEKPIVIDHADDVVHDGAVDHSGDKVAEGDKITILRGQRHVIIEKGHIEGPELKDLGFDKQQSPSAPASDATTKK